ncbi:MAG: ABC transporter transmembrane domain-containing protein [Tepidisphaerales bacterium]
MSTPRNGSPVSVSRDATVPAATPLASGVPRAGRSGRFGPFFRALRFVYPYRRRLAVSVMCAVLVGASGTAGLSMLLPILQVLLAEDTIPRFVDRSLAERRLGATLASETLVVTGEGGGATEGVLARGVRVVRVSPSSPAAQAGLKPGLVLPVPESVLADPVRSSVSLPDGTSLSLRPPPWYASGLRAVASRLPEHPVKALAVLLGGVLALAVLANVFRFFQEHYANVVSFQAVFDLRKRVYDHVLHLPLTYFGRHGTSDVTSRLVSDCANLQEGLRLLLGQSVQAPITAGMALALAMWVDWRLTVFIVVCAPLMVAIIRTFGKKIRRATRAALEKNARMLGQLEASLSGVRVVKAARAERYERRRYVEVMRQFLEQQRRMSRYEALTTPTMETLTMAVVSVVVLVAAYLVLIDRSLEVSGFFLIMGCLVAMGENLRRLSKLNNILQRSNAAAGRIFEVLDLPTEQPRALHGPAVTPPRHLPPLRHSIVFDRVSFTYPGAAAPAVEDVSLEVPKGRVVAVVGRNGSGKTTLLSLLPRYYTPTSGRILIDGIDIATVSLSSLREQISIVTQDTVIFPGTVAQNIAYGHPLAALLDGRHDGPAVAGVMEQVRQAADRAFASDFILARDGGFFASLDGLGGQLSGGQKQRLCIARAIFRRAPILILDEATSQVDAESEHLIQQAIDTLVRDRSAEQRTTTTFVIAHRFSTIVSADEIVVMEQGRLVARGQHRQLLAESELYQQLYERQLLRVET